MKVLYLPLKREWYDMIEKGIKKEEYREFNMFWLRRLADSSFYHQINSVVTGVRELPFKPFTHVHFTLGYPKRDDMSRHMVWNIKEIVIAEGKPEWGAEPGRKYFVVRLGERV